MSRKNKSRSQKSRRSSRQRKRNPQSLFEKLEDRRLLAITLGIDGVGSDADVGPIQGSSLISGHEGESEILSFGFSIGNQQDSFSIGNQQNRIPFVSNVFVHKDFDQATPDLLTESVLGPVRDGLDISVFSENPSVIQPEISLELSQIQTSSFQTTEIEEFDGVFEDINFSFTDLEFSFKGVDNQGNFETEQSTTFDLLANKVGGAADFANTNVTDGLSLTIGKAELPIDDFSFGGFSSCSQTTCGDPTALEIIVEREVDQSTPALLEAVLRGVNLDTIVLRDQFEDNKTERDNLKWTLYEPRINSFTVEIFDDGELETENVFSLSFSKIELEQFTYKSDGSIQEFSKSTWDIVEDTASGGIRSVVEDPGELANLDHIVFSNGTTLPLTNLNFGATNSGTTHLGSGQGAGGTFVDDLSVSAAVDLTTPGIVAALAASEGMDEITINLPSVDRSLTLETASISSFNISGAESIDFSIFFDKVTSEAIETDAQGNEIPHIASYTRSTNTTTGSLPNVTFQSPNDKPDLKLTLNHAGGSTDLAIDSVVWAVTTQENGDPVASDIEFTIDSEFIAPGLFAATLAAGQQLTGATLSSFSDVDGERVEEYRWELTDIIIRNFESEFNVATSNSSDTFALNFAEVELETFDLAGNVTSSFEWNIPENTIEGSDKVGFMTKSGFTDFIDFGSDFVLPVEEFDFSAERSISEIDSEGSRTPSTASPGVINLVSNSGPSPGLLTSLGNGTNISESVIHSTVVQNGVNVPQETWTLSNYTVKEFSFRDAVGEASSTVGFSLEIESEIKAEFQSYDETGAKAANSIVEWDVSNNEFVGDTGFAGTTLEGPLPDHVLEFPGGAQISVSAFSWATENPIFQSVGDGNIELRQNDISRTSFELIANLDVATAGLIRSLGDDDAISNLTLTSYQDTPDNTGRRPFRTWTLEDVYIGDFQASDSPGQTGEFALRLDIGRIDSQVTIFDDSENESRMTPNRKTPNRMTPSTDFSDFVDYTSPPVPLGITDLQTSTVHDLTLNLTDLFTDEQELATDLIYEFTVDNDPGVFTSVTLDANNVLTLDIDNGQTGTATITVSATDSFNLIGTRTFDVLVSDAAGFLNVTTALDVVSDTDGLTSLREAIEFANSDAGADTITIPADFNRGQTLVTTSELAITTPITIQGPGADLLTISGDNQHRVFNIDDSDDANVLSVSLIGLTIADGNATGSGGGILSREGLLLSGVALTGNAATADGGGIYQTVGSLFMLNSVVSANSASVGAGIYIDSGFADILNTTISGNEAINWGGGITNGINGATTNVRNATIIGNRSDSDGDGTGTGGGIDVFGTDISIFNSIVAGNVRGVIGSDVPDDISGTLMAGTFNFIGDAGTAGGLTDGVNNNLVGNNGTGTADLTSIVDTTLRDNGGLTHTHRLFDQSPLVDAGNIAVGPGLSTDQRGVGFDRIADGDGNGTSTIDIGAFELDSIAPVIESFVINGGDAQRSSIRELTITFSEIVNVDSSSLMLENIDLGIYFTPNVSTQVVGGKTVATLTFNGSGIIGGSLADGNYRLTTFDTITDGSGNQIDGNGNGSAGGNATDEFFRLYGDTNGSGNVNIFDLLDFRNSFNSVNGDANFNPALDFNGDGRVNVFDLLQFRTRFNTSI